jgi:hypothetical protein
MVYEAAFLRLKYSIKVPVAREFARRKVLFAFGLDLSGLRKWLRHISLFHPLTEADVASSFEEIKAARRREARPSRVPPPSGWLPEQARAFLEEHGFEVRDYHRSHDGWRACSSYKKLGNSVLDNNMVYYLHGNEYAVTRLELILNVNEPESSEEAELRFQETAMTLIENAVGSVRGHHQSVTLRVNAGPEVVRNMIIELKRQDWAGGIKDGYELELIVSAALPEANG